MRKTVQTITKFYSEDAGRQRRAFVLEVNGEYFVDLYEGKDLVDTVDCSGKSLRMAEDVAENFCQFIR